MNANVVIEGENSGINFPRLKAAKVEGECLDEVLENIKLAIEVYGGTLSPVESDDRLRKDILTTPVRLLAARLPMRTAEETEKIMKFGFQHLGSSGSTGCVKGIRKGLFYHLHKRKTHHPKIIKSPANVIKDESGGQEGCTGPLPRWHYTATCEFRPRETKIRRTQRCKHAAPS